jgi:hypothetical protein
VLAAPVANREMIFKLLARQSSNIAFTDEDLDLCWQEFAYRLIDEEAEELR